ncbi:hypothetical protein [Fuerstiella marisgermanici]|uniref:Plasmid related protein n=1 Tax=Fuerstiella marisgermanici TaxID=1891926 RepID=A0A1P8WQN1_9PLAN|nr:hypothetical protein [Fuerstiella marisgermanici]APZ96363.1 hypothetical protein Fuma_06032 [Fuerstiella marisgermanici]
MCKPIVIRRQRFRFGSIYITCNAQERLNGDDIRNALSRHLSGDWGDVCDEDRQENELSLREGFRLLSVYHASDGTKFWVITEADRSSTTVLLPEDY